MNRVDVQVSIFTAAVVTIFCFCICSFYYKSTCKIVVHSLEERAQAVCSYAQASLSPAVFSQADTAEDMSGPLYQDAQRKLYDIMKAAGVQRLYAVKRGQDGGFVYVADGLAPGPEGCSGPGAQVDPALYPALERAFCGESITPRHILDTGLGKAFLAFHPVWDGTCVIGVIGVAFTAEPHYSTFLAARIATPVIALLACGLSALFAFCFFRRISNPVSRDLYNTDCLTQLKNRNAFDIDLNNFTAQRRPSFGILVIDLNYLKRVNDSMGHTAGDQYLKTAARTIQSVCTPAAVPYRTGGDEFAVVLPCGDSDRLYSMKTALESVHQEFCSSGFITQLSLSIGYAVFDPGLDLDLHDTYHRADQAMYREKRRFHSQSS